MIDSKIIESWKDATEKWKQDRTYSTGFRRLK